MLRELKLGLLKIEVRQSGRMEKRTVVLHNTEKHAGCLAVLSRLALTLEKMLNSNKMKYDRRNQPRRLNYFFRKYEIV